MSFWLGVDERLDETVHQYEPHYNTLHSKWKSTCHSYVSRGLAKSILPDDKYNECFTLLKNRKIKAILFELGDFHSDNKVHILNILKIF